MFDEAEPSVPDCKFQALAARAVEAHMEADLAHLELKRHVRMRLDQLTGNPALCTVFPEGIANSFLLLRNSLRISFGRNSTSHSR